LQLTWLINAMVGRHAAFQYTRGDGLRGRNSGVPAAHRRPHKTGVCASHVF
jgi:hypothetical protein